MKNSILVLEVLLNPCASRPSSLANNFFQTLLASVLISCLYSKYDPEDGSYTVLITLRVMVLGDSVGRFCSIFLCHRDSLDVRCSLIISR